MGCDVGERRAARPHAPGRRPSRIQTLQARVAELEDELTAARKTIRALIDKAEARARSASPDVAVFEAAAQMEAIIGERTREVAEKSSELAAANAELRAVMANLDQIVRQRTRALEESEAQLRLKNQELDRLNRMKGEFISIAAHELRTPMTSIVGYLDLIVEGRFGELPESLARPTRSLRRNAHRLKRLVDEMLDVSRIEAGRVTLYRTPCSLGDITRDVVDELSPLAADKQQRVTVEVDEVPRIDADRDKIHQVVSNLIANAIRYSEDGGEIALSVDRAPEDRFPGRWARLRVRDNGVGIPVSEHGRIFEPFSDVHTAKHHTSTGPGSAGLGLYIARGLVELHGGVIAVASEEGHFTEFTVLLPFAAGPAARSPRRTHLSPRAPRPPRG